ncbi:peptidase inhibitor family I36 protein [Amycolatopsis sp. 195334CR]|uniref:peptidase inhibitor family I36 protein n=1 Tax=Amycolatopsis sp. 195334CR TaxID=2814588 RepID=UPI001A8C606A|nr:peptidase inhibitor family I36 protein [Amycolatopsis sp. 195334CR]MBN6041226.1 peptidase inhibitor family I36 protein [Amycolatopsis sp. 195334CR]
MKIPTTATAREEGGDHMRRAALTLSIITASMSLFFGHAAASTAAVPTCDPAELCIWTKVNFEGPRFDYPPPNRELFCVNIIPALSGWNKTDLNLVVNSGFCENPQTGHVHHSSSLKNYPFVVHSISYCARC